MLTTLPSTYTTMTRLRELRLSKNKFKKIPECILALTDLRCLDMDSNVLKTLPDAIASMTGLRVLRLSSNRLKTLPESVNSLTGLQELYIARNRFETLDVDWSSTRAPIFTGLSLTVLDVAGNKRLTTLPASIGALGPTLERLELRNCSLLRTLPGQLTMLTQLQFLGHQLRHPATPSFCAWMAALHARDKRVRAVGYRGSERRFELVQSRLA